MKTSPTHADAFRQACSQFASGVAIATVFTPEGSPHGLTVSSFTSVSLDPPMVLVCVDHGCSVLPYFRESGRFGVNVLSEDQRELSVGFSVKPEGRFEGVSWFSRGGSPLIHNALAHFDCLTKQIVEAGDHSILIGEVELAGSNPGEPLLYFNRAYRRLG